jgi:hypothetical protein
MTTNSPSSASRPQATRSAKEFGRYGMLHVRYGKAVRGQLPRRCIVPSVMGWAVEAVADYVENIRPRFGVRSIRRCG